MFAAEEEARWPEVFAAEEEAGRKAKPAATDNDAGGDATTQLLICLFDFYCLNKSVKC